MLRLKQTFLKQTLFPVLFLTQGDKGDGPQFFDVRTWSINISLCFIVAEHLSGLAAPAFDIISNKEVVNKCTIGLIHRIIGTRFSIRTTTETSPSTFE